MPMNQLHFSPNDDAIRLDQQHAKQIDLDGGHSLTANSRSQNKCGYFMNVVTSKVFVACVLVAAVGITIVCVSLLVSYEMGNGVVNSVSFWNKSLPKEQAIWFDMSIQELKGALSVKLNSKRAKNVILFVGDGMGPNTVTATRIYKGREESLLSWEKFPHMGLLKTYCANKQVPDSFSTATALFCGVKANYQTGGVDSSVHLGHCTDSRQEIHQVHSIIKWAQNDGMKTGFVTTTRVTHATPAALYAHVPDRRWECEAKVPEAAKSQHCKDIGRTLIEDEPGKSINVIMGGGRQCLVSNITGSDSDPIDTWSCYSQDGRNLISDWQKDKQTKGANYAVLSNNRDLSLVDKQADFVLGIFSNGHLKYDHERDKGPNGMPSIKDMTIKAIEILKSKDKGFLLVVEGGNIDQAHHRGSARKALSETSALDEAVKAAVGALQDDLDETLIIVTADHSHTLTINGYPDRGSNILGIASNSRTEQTPYTTLTYGTSYRGFQVNLTSENEPKRRDPSREDTTSYDYTQQAAINTDENTHGGSDVTVHANGPMAHLFHKIHDQTYVAHVISYALRIGRFSDSTIVESLPNILGL